MCTKDTMQSVLRELHLALSRIYGAALYKVFLYGSYARGDYHDDSDIDIMVLVTSDDAFIKQRRNDLMVCESQISLRHDVVLSIYVKNNTHFEHWKEQLPYYRNIVTEGVEIGA